MREKVTDIIKVTLMLGISMLALTLMLMHKSKAHAPDIIVANPIPLFYSKSAEDGLWEALHYYNIEYPEIVYAQAILETGHFKSQGCLRDNNLFGLYNSRKGRYYKFDHWTESVVAYKDWIQRRYKPPENYYKFLKRINYASDSLYTQKLKQIVRQNEKRRSIGVCPSDSLSLHAPSIPNRVW